MKHWKKYLAAASTGCILLVLIIALNNNSGKKDLTALKSSTPVKESLQTTEVNYNSQEDNIVMSQNVEAASMEADSAEAKIVSKEDINAEINQLINTYYNVSDSKDGASNKTAATSNKTAATSNKTAATSNKSDTATNKSDTATNKTIADDSDKDNSGKIGQSEDKQTSEKETKDTQKSDIVEGYKNLKNYVKPGLNKDSYMVFTTYDIKLYNIDTLVPGMSSLSVVRDENGALVINEDISDGKLKKHIQKLTKEKDIKKVISKVNAKLKEAVKKDAALKGFIDYLE